MNKETQKLVFAKLALETIEQFVKSVQSYQWRHHVHCSVVSIVDFEQVNEKCAKPIAFFHRAVNEFHPLIEAVLNNCEMNFKNGFTTGLTRFATDTLRFMSLYISSSVVEPPDIFIAIFLHHIITSILYHVKFKFILSYC